MDSCSKEGLINGYLQAEARRANSKSIWFLIGGFFFALIGGIVCIKIGISDNWAIFPGCLISAVGLMWALAEKSECDEAFNRMRDCANLKPTEFHEIRDILN